MNTIKLRLSRQSEAFCRLLGSSSPLYFSQSSHLTSSLKEHKVRIQTQKRVSEKKKGPVEPHTELG